MSDPVLATDALWHRRWSSSLEPSGEGSAKRRADEADGLAAVQESGLENLGR